jgi:hypothetical protein
MSETVPRDASRRILEQLITRCFPRDSSLRNPVATVHTPAVDLDFRSATCGGIAVQGNEPLPKLRSLRTSCF